MTSKSVPSQQKPLNYKVRWAAIALLGLGSATVAIVGARAQSVTAGQPAQGKASYAKNCVSCHGANLEGNQFGPALKGEAFTAHWSGQSPALFAYIQTKMPPSGPGTLSSQTYTDIEAFILQVNGISQTAENAAPAEQARQPTPSQAAAAKAPRQPPLTLREPDAVFKATLARRTAKLADLTPVTDALLRDPPEADWLIWRRTYQNLGYSPLKQINKRNVRELRTAWSWSLPISQNEITPLVHDGVMFIESGATVQALDAATGDLLWQYIRPLADDLENGRTSRVKTLAIYEDKLYVPTADGHLIALDVKTGKLVWDQEIITAAEGAMNGQPEGVALHLTGGPIIVKGKVIIGVSLGVNNAKGGCFIVGLDAQTGKEIWRFNTIARPGQPGGDSWNGAPVEERFGAGVWTAGSYDPQLNLVYFGTGNTYDTATLLEPHAAKGESNDGLYTDSTVALNPDTGKLVWYYQHVKRDVWDLDWVFEQSLISLAVDGKPRKLVVTGGKIALFDALDGATGQYVFSKDVGLQNLVTGIDPKTGEKTINPALEPEAGKAKLLCPSPSGARSWPATAFNPQTKILYVPMIESCSDYTYAPRSAAETAAGGSDFRFSMRVRPDADGNFGRLQAINLQTKQVLWTRRQRAPIASSMLATGGGLVFNGALDRRFSAYDEATGKVVWQTRLNASPSSSPVTYLIDGRQYIALVTGGGSAFDAGTRALTPEIDSPAGGTTVVVFELPTN